MTFLNSLGLYVGGRPPNHVRIKSIGILSLYVACELGVSPFNVQLCETLGDLEAIEKQDMFQQMSECVTIGNILPLTRKKRSGGKRLSHVPNSRWWWNGDEKY